jgi:hypothetical protein
MMKQLLSLRSLVILVPLVLLLDLVIRFPGNRFSDQRTGKRTGVPTKHSPLVTNPSKRGLCSQGILDEQRMVHSLLPHPLRYLSDWLSLFVIDATS